MRTVLLSLSVIFLGVLLLLAAAAQQTAPSGAAPQATATQPEKHLRNIKQLTFGGQNAEAYFSVDGKKLIFQSTREPVKCDQIFIMNTEGSNQHMVSTGKGRTTCSFWYPDGKKILYASTHLGSPDCPPKPDYSKGYVWAIYSSFDIFTANPDGSNVKQLTDELGYDGGPTFSPDGKLVVYRAHHPKTEQEIKDYKDLLAQNLIRPTYLEIWTMKTDGSDKRQITDLGAASFAPAFYHDGKHIIFSSNVGSTGGMGNFELYGVDLDGKNLQRLTFTDGFDGFPMFSPDGKQLVWISGRNGKVPHETNVFIADWVP